MSIALNAKNVLALSLVVVLLWAMTDCGGQRICRLRGGVVLYEVPSFGAGAQNLAVHPDNWACTSGGRP